MKFILLTPAFKIDLGFRTTDWFTSLEWNQHSRNSDKYRESSETAQARRIK